MLTDDQAGRETAGARECDHMIGYRALGGMPGHEHSHPTGPQLCVKCGKTLDELLSEARAEGSRSREGAEELIEARKEIARLRDDTHTCGENSLLPVERTGGCGGKILGPVFRCADCGTPFHRECLKKHFGGEIHAQVSELRAACAAQQATLRRRGEALFALKSAAAYSHSLFDWSTKGAAEDELLAAIARAEAVLKEQA